MNILYSWLGKSDLEAAGSNGKDGPVADALLHIAPLDRAVLLLDHAPRETLTVDYRARLEKRLALMGKDIEIDLRLIPKDDPTSYNWVFDAMRSIVSASEAKQGQIKRHYLVGPGTPTMAACTLILSRIAACAGELWQSDVKSAAGCRRLELPFDVRLADAPDPQCGSAQRWADALDTDPTAPIVVSPAMIRAWELAKRAAASRWPVLILGSTGTGKEVLAKHIFESSELKNRPFRTINCGAIPETLIEAELFGYKKGAFTGASQNHPGIFEAAATGMVFLDEVGELPLAAQVKFLRVLQEGKVTRLGEHEERTIDCRILAATHRNLWRAVRDGRFREDLYFRLAGILIELPDLVERRKDLDVMIDRFWQQAVSENPGFPGRTLNEEARQRLLAHPWPGNVRELRATLVRAAFLAEAHEVGAHEIESALACGGTATEDEDTPRSQSRAGVPDVAVSTVDLKDAVKQFKRQQVEQALAQAQGNQARAARALGITAQHIGRLLRR